MRRQWVYLLIILVSCLGYSRAEASEGLTLSAVLKMAFDQNPRMIQARAALKSSQAERGIVSRWDNPQVEIEPDRISIKQPFDPLGVRHIKGKIAKNEVLLQEQLLREVWAEVYLEIREAYTGILLTEKQYELQQQNLKAMRQFFSHVQMRYQSGQLSLNQMQRSRIELLNTQGNVLKAASELDIAKARLNMLLGRSRTSPVDLIDILDEGYQKRTLEELLGQAMAQSPRARGQRLRLESAKYIVRQEHLSRLPSFALGLTQTNQKDDDDADHNTALIVEFSVPLWTAFNQGAINKARAQEEQEASKLKETLGRLDFDVYRLDQQLQVSLAQLELAQKARQAAQDMFTLASVRYQEGDMSFTEYLEQFKSSTEARAKYYDTLDVFNRHISELEKTMYGSLRQEEFLK